MCDERQTTSICNNWDQYYFFGFSSRYEIWKKETRRVNTDKVYFGFSGWFHVFWSNGWKWQEAINKLYGKAASVTNFK